MLHTKERAIYRKVSHIGFVVIICCFPDIWYNCLIVMLYLLFQRLIAVLDELEALKPEFQHRLKELDSEWPVANKKSNPRVDVKQVSKHRHCWYMIDLKL